MSHPARMVCIYIHIYIGVCVCCILTFDPAKHAIPKIEWAIELLYNSVKTGSQ